MGSVVLFLGVATSALATPTERAVPATPPAAAADTAPGTPTSAASAVPVAVAPPVDVARLSADVLPSGAIPLAVLPAPPAHGESGAGLLQSPPPSGPQIEYYALDALGSVRVVFDQAGAVKARADYEPFGAALPSTTGPLPREQFTGQQRDSEVGLDYFGARFYHASHGRMLSVDPLYVGAVGTPQRWNRYAYALASPLNLRDPDGRQPSSDLCPAPMSTPDFRTNTECPMPGIRNPIRPGPGLIPVYPPVHPDPGPVGPVGPIGPTAPTGGGEKGGGNEGCGVACPPPPPPPAPPEQETAQKQGLCRSLPALPDGHSYSGARRIGVGLLFALDVGSRAMVFKELVQNKGPFDIKQDGGQYEAAGNVHYGVMGMAAGLGPLVPLGSLYAHVRDQWDTGPFSWANVKNELGDQVNVAKGMAAAVACW